MSIDATIVVPFGYDKGSSRVWIRLAQNKIEDETVTISHAAKIIDYVYELEPCDNPNDKTGGEPVAVEDAERLEYLTDLEYAEMVNAYNERLQNAFLSIGYDPCKTKLVNGIREFETSVNVYRSDVQIPYNLVLSPSGSIDSTEYVQMDVDTVIEVDPETSSGSIPYPVIDDDVELIECSKKVLSIEDLSIKFEKGTEGFVHVKYPTRYDVVHLTVQIIEDTERGTDFPTLLTAFYSGIVNYTEIEHPEEDLEAIDYMGCGTITVDDLEEAEEDPEQITCFQRVIEKNICYCSGETASIVDYINEVECPPAGHFGSGNTTEQAAYQFWWEARNIISYVECGDEGEDWDGNDKEYYKEQCCQYPQDVPVSLPLCREKKSVWRGGRGIINGPDYYKAFHGQTVKLIPVNPPDMYCGDIVTTQVVSNKNCCDLPGLTDVEYDFENSVETIADYDSGYIFWSGGTGIYDISIRGDGFYFDSAYTTKDINGYTGTGIKVFVENGCGGANITVSDGCSNDAGGLKSTDGEWISLGDQCLDKGAPADEIIPYIGRVKRAIAYRGNYKQTQLLDYNSGLVSQQNVLSPLGTSCPDAPGDCNGVCDESLGYEDFYADDGCNYTYSGWDIAGCLTFNIVDHTPLVDWWTLTGETNCHADIWGRCVEGDYSIQYRCQCQYYPKVKRYYGKELFEWRC